MTPALHNKSIKNREDLRIYLLAKPERNEAISLMGFKYLLFGTSNSSNK